LGKKPERDEVMQPGIYRPGRGPTNKLKQGTARRIANKRIKEELV